MKKSLFVLSATFSIVALLSSSMLIAQNTSPYWSLIGNSNATSSSKLGTTNAINLGLFTNNIERMRIATSGNVGIGTINPLTKFHVNGLGSFGNSITSTNAIRALNLVDANAVMRILRVSATSAPAIELLSRTSADGPNVAYWDLYAQPTDASFRIRDRQSGSTTLDRLTVLHTNGNVGIGTSAPEAKLHVFKGSAGSVTGFGNAPLIVENSTSCYINILAPDATETGILFGKPADAIGGGIVYSTPATLNGLQFRTNGNIPRMVLTDVGNLGVGTVTPGDYKLKVSCPYGYRGLDIESTQGSQVDWEIYTSPNDGYGSNGDLELYYNTFFKGSFNSTSGAYTSVSDERLKTNIKPMSTMLEKIRQLKPSTYQFKNTTDKQEYNGFIAQDVMKIFPSLVTHNVNPERKLDVYTMDYSGFGVLAIKGIQELQPIIEEQKEQIASLKERIGKLETALATITAHNNENISNVIAHASLEQNKPNPFNKNTIIRYNIPKGSRGQINIYDQAGKLTKALKANENGRSELNSSVLAAGTYTYTLMVNGKVALSKQMLIIK